MLTFDTNNLVLIDHTKMCFLVFLLVTMPLNYVHGDSFLPVTNTCKYWDPVSVFRTPQAVVLHCILDENYNLGIVNTTWKLISKGHCPFFNRHTGDIDIFNCNEDDGGCPTSAFASYQATQFSGCMTENRLRMRNIEPTFTCTSNHQDQQLLVWFPIIAVTHMGIWFSMICYICFRHGFPKKIWQTLFDVKEKVKKRMKSKSKSTLIEAGAEEDIGYPEPQGAWKMSPPAYLNGEDADGNLLVETPEKVGKGNDTQYTPYNKGHDAIQRKISLEEISMSENSVAPNESAIVVTVKPVTPESTRYRKSDSN